MGKLTGKVAAITGATGGIGGAIAELFEEEGAIVVTLDLVPGSRNPDARRFYRTDVRDAVAVEEVVDRIIRDHSRIDILVNSAGIIDEAPFTELTPERWDRTLDIDLRGTFLVSRFVAPHMIEAGSGRIINISSQLGIKGGVGLAHYVAAKAGVIGLTKALALELAPHGILVNSIAPGPVTTALTAGLSEEWKREKTAELPLGRFGMPNEIAPTALLLASSPGGDIYVGQTLGPNSGDVMP